MKIFVKTSEDTMTNRPSEELQSFLLRDISFVHYVKIKQNLLELWFIKKVPVSSRDEQTVFF